MAKKKSVVRKKPSKRSSSKNSSRPKMGLDNINARLQRSNKWLIYSFVVFLISMVIYIPVHGFLASLFGLVMILSGALTLLFLITSIVLYVMKRKL